VGRKPHRIPCIVPVLVLLCHRDRQTGQSQSRNAERPQPVPRLSLEFPLCPEPFVLLWVLGRRREMAQCRRWSSRQFVRCETGATQGAGTELPDDAAAREFAAKVMRGLVQQQDDDWHGWTMEVRQGGRLVWQLPFDAIEPPTAH
jgi:hypothetical protein